MGALHIHDTVSGDEVVTQALSRIHEHDDVRYLEYAFHDPRFLHEARALCRGTTGRARLNPDDFLKLKLRLPTREEQARIADVIATAQQEIDHAQRHLIALRKQKRGLMQRLLTGQGRVRAEEEPAIRVQ